MYSLTSLLTSLESDDTKQRTTKALQISKRKKSKLNPETTLNHGFT